MSTLRLCGPRPLRGRLRVPGDKSISHRALVFAAVATGRSRLRGLGTGDDVTRTRQALAALGVRLQQGSEGEFRITGAGWDGLREPEAVLDCGNSGTTMRVLLGVLAGRPFHAVLTGDTSLRRRPMARIVEPLRHMGATIDGREGGGRAPLAVRGAQLVGIRHEMPVASAQVKTGLILAGLQANGETEIVEPAPCRDHTERMLRSLGVEVAVEGRRIRVARADIPPFDIEVPGDPSSAAFFLVGALLVPGSELTVEGVALNPTRTGFVDVLRRMGGHLEVEQTGEVCGEPVGSIRAVSSPLRGTVIEGDEIPAVIDELPVLAMAAAFAEGRTEIRDAAELVVKESDRIGALREELTQLGVTVEARPDGLTIEGGVPKAGIFKGHGDHRVAMAAAIAANACPGESIVKGWAAVAASYPEFADHLAAVAEER